ncbi:HAMP domain-containing protein [Alkalicaulis satelles]|uniref:histidine kinase n=2 Tax=Alkalicaulis satelles TaxID=2609175 RepID=A0A5M6ZT42_9PROT|nr:HAMP domain-containing protein [Alkalicaulis satelles]
MSVSTGTVWQPSGLLFRSLLALTVLMVGGLAIAVVLRAASRLRARKSSEPAPRLQMRFITLFAVAAIAPALLMASFHTLVLNRGIEFWFGERVTVLVEASTEMARGWPSVALSFVVLQFQSIADNLSDPEAMQALQDSRILYRNYLTQQAMVRNFPALYVIDSRATVLARSEEAPGTPEFAAPTRFMFEAADEGDIGASDPVVRQDGPDYMRLLIRMPAYEDAYLYAVWFEDFSMLVAPEAAIASFREGVDLEQQMRNSFLTVYALAAVLILVGAIWLALSASHRVTAPVSRLVSAAERVRRGDLDARVNVARDDDEIAALGRAFNRMTRQLSSQRKALLETNAENERRRAFIEAVLTGVSAGVMGLDHERRITLVNRTAAMMLGFEPSDLVGRELAEAAPVFVDVVEEVSRRPADIAERQIDLPGEDGSVVNLNVRAGHDDQDGVVLTFDDVTRLVAAQRNAAWRDVARRIAHEIKNPLTPIQLSAERLRRKYRKTVMDHDVETFDRCVETIVRQVSDIGRMVDEFSAFARMPAPKMEAADLSEIARASVFAQRVASPGVKVSFEGPDPGPLVECDSRLAGQALANILKNAAESVSARMERDNAKSPGLVAVQVYEQDGFGVIEARDDGLGWPVADKARLTEPYMTTREKGTGLGLAIVRRVMEDHGGRLDLDDPAPGETGAVVRLAFPLLDSRGSLSGSVARAEA